MNGEVKKRSACKHGEDAGICEWGMYVGCSVVCCVEKSMSMP